jgi:hypothetical protein
LTRNFSLPRTYTWYERSNPPPSDRTSSITAMLSTHLS